MRDQDYRPDIDGLRAVAVVSVTLYHLGVGFTKGGFIGVDVFFVISGFLITGLLKREMLARDFSILTFYERRMRRLLPAFFVLLFFCFLTAAVLLFPHELRRFAKTLIASTFYAANLLLVQGDGYFQSTTETMPLMHTWSLAVEEQFYLFYPFILLLLLKWGPRTAAAGLSVIGVLTFWLSIVLVKRDQAAAFFLLPPRAWELIVGGLIALNVLPPLYKRQHRELAGAAGLAAVLIATGAINRNNIFPGWSVVAPCIGSAAIIYSGAFADTYVYRLLSSRYLVFLGLISYSLYLWHWPIIAFYKASHSYDIPNATKTALGLISLAVASLSWRYVETPFRRRELAPTRRAIFSLAAIASLAALVVGLGLIASDGLSIRVPARAREFANFRYSPSEDYRQGTCFITRSFATKPAVDAKCLATDGSRQNYLLIGDSHAAHLWAGLKAVYSRINFLQATASGCKPVLSEKAADRCRSVIDNAYGIFLPKTHVDGIVLSAAWTYHDIDHLRETVRALRRFTANIYVFGPIVEYDDLLPRVLARSAWHKDATLVEKSRLAGLQELDDAFAKAMIDTGAKYVSIYRVICAGGPESCRTLDGAGRPLQWDKAHLTKAGATWVATSLKSQHLFQ